MGIGFRNCFLIPHSALRIPNSLDPSQFEYSNRFTIYDLWFTKVYDFRIHPLLNACLPVRAARRQVLKADRSRFKDFDTLRWFRYGYAYSTQASIRRNLTFQKGTSATKRVKLSLFRVSWGKRNNPME